MLDQDVKDLMAGLCSPVTVITTADADGPHGATVSSFASLSMTPPLVSIALDRGSALLARVLTTGRFGVNVLGAGSDDLAMVFARRGADRFADLDWSADHGLPRLADAAAWADCALDQVVEAGDHLLLIGRVEHADAGHHARAGLVYGYRTFGTHSRFGERPRTRIRDQIAACAR